MKRRQHGLLDLGAAESFRCCDHRVDVEELRITVTLLQVNREDRAPRLGGRKIDEEDLVEPAFAQEFRRERFDVVGGRDQEDRSTALRSTEMRAAIHGRTAGGECGSSARCLRCH